MDRPTAESAEAAGSAAPAGDPGGGLLRHVKLRSATALVVANIIGAGVFTSTGFQAADLPHPGYIFLLWIVGGLLALCGALCYGELGAAMPEAGGEYAYLRTTYGRAFGFLSAFVSLVAGFAAPVASAVKSFAAYLRHFFPALADDPLIMPFLSVRDLIAISVVWGLIAVHLQSGRKSVGANDVMALLKVIGIVAILLGAVAYGSGDLQHFTYVPERFSNLTASTGFAAFATSLVFVMFCYSGWNASAYIASEMKDPQRDLPRSLILGTGLVIALYLGLNAVYFYGADVNELAGQVEVGLIAAERLFGPTGTTLVTIVLTVSILASASAMTIAGPRVSYALGKDVRIFRSLARTSRTGAPRNALFLQGAVTTLLIVSGRIDQIQQYAGFTLTLFSSLAVACVIVLRIKRPDLPRPYRTFLYPVTPIVFLICSVWMMVWAVQGRPMESMAAFLTVAVGGVVFFVAERLGSNGRGSRGP